ncbi:MAG: prepilin-type N-terminal cleavage/methylation domain-containing protein [Methylotenera sp.]|nr:prepilin-type N-terminal cleavage/methylation domain-containing protein [Methylotenera sp.]
MKKQQTGFTLIELAIVLVIIGLLLGGVLKGQELINSAKVKNLANDFRTIPVYIYGYQDKFKALPGDDRRAVTHVGAGTNGNGDGALGGTWFAAGANNAAESYQFWQHVRLANLAAGATDIANVDWRPTNADGNPIGIMAGTNNAAATAMLDGAATPAAIKGSYVICSQGVLGKYVIQLDVTMDDGNSATGAMLASRTNTPGLALPADTGIIDPAASYIVCYGV